MKLTFNLKSATSAFDYQNIPSPIKIISVSPSSYSPVLKGFMTVTGEGFGTDKSLINAWLMKDGINVYPLNVIQITDTTLKLRIPGG